MSDTNWAQQNLATRAFQQEVWSWLRETPVHVWATLTDIQLTRRMGLEDDRVVDVLLAVRTLVSEGRLVSEPILPLNAQTNRSGRRLGFGPEVTG